VAAGSAAALVVSQSPAAGSTLELGALVRLTFAAQPAPSTSP
jgi:beta-lactam-binding protein with PASTA domain